MTLTDEQTAKLTTLSDRLLQLTADGFRCETCKWWEPKEYDCSTPIGGVCDRGVVVRRDEPLATYWLTAPDFGCVQWGRG